MTTNHDMIDAFDPNEFEVEAAARWGETQAYQQSARRTRRYTPEQWQEIQRDSDTLTTRFAELFDAGIEPTEQVVLEAAAAWRRHVDRWFYTLTPDIQRGLGELYVADPRFVAYYGGDDDARAGYALWMRDAFAAYADSRE